MEHPGVKQILENQVLTVVKAVEEKLDDEIAALDRLDLDDIEVLRERRLQQMKKMAEKRNRWVSLGHGDYSEIPSEKDFFSVVKASDRVVCHFYRENWPCKVMDKHMSILAKQHIETRFVKINAEKSPFLADRLKIVVLPTLALIKNAKVDDYVKKGSSDTEERAGKAYARATELQKQLDQLKKETESQSQEKNDLKSRANKAQKKIEDLNLKLKNLQKVSDEQKGIIRKTERALQVAEEEMMKAKLEASSRSKELMEAHGSWLPPWLAEHAIRFQVFIVKEWNEHGEPLMKILYQKGMEIETHLETLATPHIVNMKTKWIPAVKDKWLLTVEYLEPHLKLASAKTAEAYVALKTNVKPHVITVQELTDPYYQEVKKFSKPYVDQIATVAKPCVEKARIAIKPYTEKAVDGSRKFLESATAYHHQVQATVREKMKNHEFMKHLATNEFVWFAASAILALPVIILSRLCSAMFLKKAKNMRHAQPHHQGRRKGKRGHSEK